MLLEEVHQITARSPDQQALEVTNQKLHLLRLPIEQ